MPTAKAEPPVDIEHRVDIVERLRASHHLLTAPWLSSVYSEAADEIERLRKIVAELRGEA